MTEQTGLRSYPWRCGALEATLEGARDALIVVRDALKGPRYAGVRETVVRQLERADHLLTRIQRVDEEIEAELAAPRGAGRPAEPEG